MNLETEIRQETNLCDKSGNLNLNSVGWSKKPLHRCNLSGHYLRKKNGIIGAFTTKISWCRLRFRMWIMRELFLFIG